MKKLGDTIKRIASAFLSLIFIFSIFCIVPVVKAEEPVWSEAFVKRLNIEHPLNEGQVYVGYGKADITPIPYDNNGNTGLGLGGYGRDEYRLGVWGGSNTAYQHRLYAYCVAVMDGDGNIVLFNTNDFSQPSRYEIIRKKVSEKTGVPEEKIQVSGNHTHSSVSQSITPPTKTRARTLEYFDYEDKQIITACTNAIRDLYPSDIYVKSVDAVENGKNVSAFVRHYEYSGKKDFNGNTVIGSDNHGFIYWNSSLQTWIKTSTGQAHTTNGDAQIQIARFERKDDNNILLCNFQAHAQTLGGNSNTNITPDYIADFRDEVEKAAPNYRVAFFQGAAGNLNARSSLSSETPAITNTTGSDISYDFNGVKIVLPNGANITNMSASYTKNGITLSSEEIKRLAVYLMAKKLASFVTEDIDTLTNYKKVNAGNIKTKEYTFSNEYHFPSDDKTTKSAQWITSLIWNSSDTSLKQILIGEYAFTDEQIEYMSVINENVYNADINKILTKSKRTDLTTEQATIIAKFVKRVQGCINNESELYTYNGTYSLFSSSTTSSNRFADTSKFSTPISQNARTRLIRWLGGLVQSKDGGEIIQSPYHANAIVTRYKSEGTIYSLTVTAATIGGLSFVMFPGEMYDTGGVYIKQNTPGDMTFFLGYTNGSNGYFPSAYGHLYTSYETDTTRVNQGSMELLAGISADLVSDLTFENDVYQMNVNETKSLKKSDNTALFSNTDSFDYATYGAKYNDNNLARFSYSNNVKWVSSNPLVATVNNGVITAVGKGTAVITAIHTGSNALGRVSSQASCTVVVGNHNHSAECAKIECTDKNHKKYEFTEWTSTTSLPTNSGYYYLKNDVVLSEPVSINNNVTLCLNGKTVKANGENGALVIEGGKFTLCDCNKNGNITRSGEISSGKSIVTVKSGEFNLYSGMIDAYNAYGVSGLAIYNTSSGKLNINGGLVLGGNASENGSAILSNGVLTVKGGTIEGKTATGNGGAVYSNGSLNITGGKIIGGTATLGGTLYLEGENNNISGGIIDGGSATTGGCVALAKNAKMIFSGGAIQNGQATKGGCLYIASNSTALMSNGEIKNGSTTENASASNGGNIFIDSSSVFNMTGGNVENGVAYGMGGNVCNAAASTFNMSGGTINGGTAMRYTNSSGTKEGGHGGNVYCVGGFNLSGGTVLNGTAKSVGGGNFSVNSASSRLKITGGVVKNGTSSVSGKGNVFIWHNASTDCFVMSGGTITDDSSFERVPGTYGGGVYISDKNAGATAQVERTLSISGNAKIYGNINTTSFNSLTGVNTKTYSNVYLESGKFITVGNCSNAKIGVTMQDKTGEFTIGGASARLFFESDNNSYYVVSSGDNLALSDTPDETPVPIEYRKGKPSDVALPDPDSILPEPSTQKDGYIHYQIEWGDVLNLRSLLNATEVTKITDGDSGYISNKDSCVIEGEMNGADIFRVNTPTGYKECVVTVGHYHCLECGTFGCQIHNNVDFYSSNTLYTNRNIFLNSDITLSEVVSVAANSTGNICLNGHKVYGPNNNKIFNMTANGTSTLSITDCNENAGSLISLAGTGDTLFSGSGGLITINKQNTFNLYNGTLDSSNVKFASGKHGGVVNAQLGGTVNMYGGKITAGENNTVNGGLIFLYPSSGQSGNFNMYGGVLDASRVVCSGNGAAIHNNSGNVTIYNGTIKGGKAQYGGFIHNTGTFIMNGGTVDCYDVIIPYASAINNQGTVIINNGRIIGGTNTASTTDTSTLYAGGYNAAITLKAGSVTTINNGVIQDGTAIFEPSSTIDNVYRHNGGNIYVADSAVLNINGGIIYGGIAYGCGGNINTASGAVVNITNGLITDGKAYKAFRDDTNAGDGSGGNIRTEGILNMSGGVIQNGLAYTYGGNVSLFNTGAVFNMTGGTIKNGIVTSSYAGSGNVAVWYHSGNTEQNKFAFDMSGGLITCDKDYPLPSDDFSIGGIISKDQKNSGYGKRFKISGSAVIKDNVKYNLVVSDDESSYIYIGELNDDALITITAPQAQKIAYYADPLSISHIRLDENSNNCILYFDEETNVLSTVYTDKTNAIRFIDSYLKDQNGNYYILGLSDLLSSNQLDEITTLWNELDSEEQKMITAVYKDLTGVNNLDEMINESEDMQNAIDFINNKFSVNGKAITKVSIDNFRDVADLIDNGAEESYETLSEKSKTYVEQMLKEEGSVSSAVQLMENAKEYIKMIKVNYTVEASKKRYIFYSGIDNITDYDEVGFILEFANMTTTISTEYVCTENYLSEDHIPIASAVDLSESANYVYVCDYYLYYPNYNQTAYVYTFIKKSDGTVVYGDKTAVLFSYN